MQIISHDSQMKKDTPETDWISSIKQMPKGVEMKLGGGQGETVRLEILRADVLRMSISRDGLFETRPSFAVSKKVETAKGEFDFEDQGDTTLLRTSAMRVSIQKNPFLVTATRPDGSLIFEGGIGEAAGTTLHRRAGDGFEVVRRCGVQDRIYGLGEKTGSFNRSNRKFTLWNSDVLSPNVSGGYSETPHEDPLMDPTSLTFDPYYISIPFFYHMPDGGHAMAGFFFDNAQKAHFDFSAEGEYRIRFEGGHHTEYIFAGPDMAGILEAYSWVTGRISAPPIWALGNHQCRWHDYNQERFEALAERMRSEEVPCDVVWLDIEYMDGYRVFTWDSTRFPDPAGMLRSLEEKKLRVITIIDPGVKRDPGYAVYDDALAKNLLCRKEDGEIYIGQVWPGDTAFPDFVKAETREWWGKLNASHVRSGIAGIWNDMNEPATGNIPEHGMLFDDGRHAHAEFHNQYALLMAMGTVAGLLEAMPDKRTFVLSRAGSAGIQRYAANWLGDNVSRWDHLWLGIPMAMGLGISGQPFVGADVGGFMGTSNAELLVRWQQYGALTPFCRNHNSMGQPDQYPWTFGEETKELCRQAITLRYRLLPYIYSEFFRAMETGLPIQRPLVLDYQNDQETWDMDDQFLLGPGLLVAPVYEQGATEREVYLPEGTWYCWHTNQKKNGPCRFQAKAPLDRIPLFAKGGAVIPCWANPPQSTMDFQPESIELHVFVPDADGETHSMLQEDDGLTFAFRDGAFIRTGFTLSRIGNRVQLSAQSSGDGYKEFVRTRFELVFHGLDTDLIQLDGRTVPVQGDRLVIQNNGQGFELAAEVSR